MITDTKLYSKKLLQSNTLRLFFVSLLSLALKAALIAAVALFSHLFLTSDYFKAFSMQTDKYLAYFLALFALNILRIAAFLLIFGIKLGESFVYFKRAAGEHGSFSLLFRFLSPKKAARAFSLYCKISFFKLMWLLFFLLPSAICGYSVLLLYKSAVLTMPAFYTLLGGTVALLLTGLAFYSVCGFRYEAAPYYMCLEELPAKKAIEKSVLFTDSAIKRALFLKLGFSGWFFSCLLLLPVFYVVPYYKLSKARFVINAVFENAAKEEKEDFPIVLLPKKAT